MKSRLSFFIVLIFVMTNSSVYSQNIRPIKDNIGFCWNANEMNHFVDYLAKANSGKVKEDSKNLVAAISVHDDYLYAGNVYFPLYSKIKTKEVVIFGVTHGSVRKEMGVLSNVLIFDEFDKWRGPYKDVEISPLRELIKSKLPKEDYIISNKAHTIEHSIEALIPFLQYYNRDIKITPIMVTQMPFERMDEMSSRLMKIIGYYIKTNKLELGKDIFFLISNDADHYGEDFNNSPYGLDAKAHKEATDNDRRILKENLAGEINFSGIKKLTTELWPDSTSKKPIPIWCGRYPITFGLLTVTKILNEFNKGNLYGKLFKYSDTFTEKVLPVKNTSMGLTAVFSYRHWCGWFTEGLYAENKKLGQ
jgi:MEMO1 family protein